MRLPGSRLAQPGVATGHNVLVCRLGYAEVFLSKTSASAKRKAAEAALIFFIFKSLNSTRLLFTITARQIEETVGIQQITMLTLVFLLLWRIGQGEGFQP